ncbi:MAG TPA: roadblock/LC7 domain-containing protein [Kiritimatiellia bacterium]|nr:roadblock/LC7 domain-containing protein [Kiritimatiellia bacterium]HNR94756.1 roadblock/LC7 domain-containing protein [Kiritimatiellia bacterium]HNS81403.1 roadblock/LC7 domain-containing protein [Kiritimatiellia bacterium]HPA77647.1 roadblock/LC7 domain-containing protein [Kiritimatiellia bacterium]HQQ03656.1 roadblock/LC7 domain-containing protein [Kiritimatiellia bacterium]
MQKLTPQLGKKIDEILLNLVVRAEAEAVLLCDRGGNIVAQNTTERYHQEDNIAALAAGSFYATRELARLIGEPVFRYIFHRGEKTSLYMQTTSIDMLVVVVFGKDSNPGLVKLYGDEACAALEELCAQNAASPEEHSETLELDSTKTMFRRK